MSSFSSYPSIFGLGHRAIKDLFNHDLNVEEKIDGSQFSFGLVPTNLDDSGKPVDEVHTTIDGVDYSLKIRSKGCVMYIDAPEKMFNLGAATVRRLYEEGKLTPGWTYRGEFLARPKHNALAYDRVPVGNIILFDVTTGEEEYLDYADKALEAARLGLEVVPLLFKGRVNAAEDVRRFLENTSILGGQKIEGVVLKPVGYGLFGIDKKVLLGKFVSEAFKEVHRKSWGESNPTTKDVTALLIASLATPARWAKAVQHLKEAGKLVHDVKDIGLIIREIPGDVEKEETDWIKDKLYAHFWPSIRRGITAGVPEWYKDQLLRSSFDEPQEPVEIGTHADPSHPSSPDSSTPSSKAE